MKTPQGIDLIVGQIWKEVDPRFTRYVEVTGWDAITGKVQLDHRTKAKVSRFNGKRCGYVWVAQTRSMLQQKGQA